MERHDNVGALFDLARQHLLANSKIESAEAVFSWLIPQLRKRELEAVPEELLPHLYEIGVQQVFHSPEDDTPEAA